MSKRLAEERKPFFIRFEFCIMEDGSILHPSFSLHEDAIGESVEENVIKAAEETIRLAFVQARQQSQVQKKLDRNTR